MEMSRRTVVTGMSVVAVGALTGIPPATSSIAGPEMSVSTLVSHWLDVQWTYRCVHRATFHPERPHERRNHSNTECAALGPWFDAVRKLGDMTDAVLAGTSVNAEDTRLKSAVVGAFWAKEGLPDCFWALPKSAVWIDRLEREMLAFGAADIRVWRPESEAALALGTEPSINAG